MTFRSMLLAIAIVGSADWTVAAATREPRIYATFSPENNAELLRGRFERWLDENRARLSSRQAAAVRAAIQSITPELLRNPQDPQETRRQLEASEKLYCALGSELAHALAQDQTPAPPVERTWTQTIQAWMHWVAECVVN